MDFSDQSSSGPIVRMQSATLSRGGFLAVHRGPANGPVIGPSEDLTPGSHEPLGIAIEEPIEGTTRLVAVPYRDANPNNRFVGPRSTRYTGPTRRPAPTGP